MRACPNNSGLTIIIQVDEDKRAMDVNIKKIKTIAMYFIRIIPNGFNGSRPAIKLLQIFDQLVNGTAESLITPVFGL